MSLRRPVAFLLAVALVSGFSPAARADWLDDHLASPLGPADGEVSTGKKVVVITGLTGMVAAFATSFVFLAQASSAEGDRADILRSNGGITDGSDAQCVTPAQCSRVTELKTDRDDAQDRWKGAMLIGAGFAAVSLATMLLWPNVEKEKKTGALQITPQAAGTSGGGVVLGGSF